MGNSASGALDATLPAPLAHSVFRAALQDLAAVGVEVSPTPVRGAKPYALIGARSNARWWLLPLETGQLAASGLALFQPVLQSTRCIKAIASWLSRAHLQHLWARRKVYISAGEELARLIGSSNTAKFAFFTGTDSPHRKVAVQIMDNSGGILAFAKISRNPDVGMLLMHEASVLRKLESTSIRGVAVPRVLHAGRVQDATILVTDTLKTPASRSATELTAEHVSFVRSLSQTTQGAVCALRMVEAEYRERVDRVLERLPPAWQERMLRALDFFSSQPDQIVVTSMCHGDFTPWNTFSCEHGLYVFDWEYASDGSLPGHDIAHFVLNATTSLGQKPARRYEKARQQVVDTHKDLRSDLVDVCLVAYLLTQSLRYVERAPAGGESIAGWDREEDHAVLLDYGLSRQRISSQ